MKIIKTYNWNRRDFCYDAECEHCKAVTKNNSGYDDSNYYSNVVPGILCKDCGKSSPQDNPTIAPKYDSHLIL